MKNSWGTAVYDALAFGNWSGRKLSHVSFSSFSLTPDSEPTFSSLNPHFLSTFPLGIFLDLRNPPQILKMRRKTFTLLFCDPWEGRRKGRPTKALGGIRSESPRAGRRDEYFSWGASFRNSFHLRQDED